MVELEKVQKRIMTESMEWLSQEQNKVGKLLLWRNKMKNYKIMSLWKR